MKHTRDITNWVQEPCSRLTVYQQIGGALYDFVDAYPPLPQSSSITKSLLTCIREETRMSDRTLKRLFLGQSDSLCNYLRILFAILQWIPEDEFRKLWNLLGNTINDYGIIEGRAFLVEQALLNRPVRKPPDMKLP